MGGLNCRYYIQLLGGQLRVDRLITISSPNHGTLLAFFTSRVGRKEIGPSSALLQKPNHDCSALRDLNVTSFWTPLDLIILPAKSSTPVMWNQ